MTTTDELEDQDSYDFELDNIDIENYSCERCGYTTDYQNDFTYVEGWGDMCQDCLANWFTSCEECDHYVPDEDMHTMEYRNERGELESTTVCPDCKEKFLEDYVTCDECGDLVHLDFISDKPRNGDDKICQNCEGNDDANNKCV